MAAGYFLGACHDFRTMKQGRGRICLNELLFGGHLNEGLMALLKSKLSTNAVSKLHRAVMILPDEALKDGMIESTYSDDADLMK